MRRSATDRELRFRGFSERLDRREASERRRGAEPPSKSRRAERFLSERGKPPNFLAS
jgi:hypothetical protein